MAQQHGEKHIPYRTCIATRALAPQVALLRCVAERTEGGETRIVPDPQRRKPGRGAWITPSTAAYETAEKRKAFARALRVPVANADTQPVRDYIASYENTAPQICGDSPAGSARGCVEG